jgi:AraC-like DNA-binding protein
LGLWWGKCTPCFKYLTDSISYLTDNISWHSILRRRRDWSSITHSAGRTNVTAKACGKKSGPDTQIALPAEADTSSLLRSWRRFGSPRKWQFASTAANSCERYEILRHGGGGEGIDMVCGAVRFDHPVARKLLAVLPRILTLDPATSPTQLEWLRSTLRLMALEAEGLRPGGETMITRLSDVLVVQALRAWLESDPAAQSGWLGALRDPQIGRAISLIHREPGRPWTVASLADQIPMSRSAFAARFTELVGEPARRNRGRTRGSFRLSLEAAFARAFKRVIGTPPGALRRAGPVQSIAA